MLIRRALGRALMLLGALLALPAITVSWLGERLADVGGGPEP
jgi:hypothetical protein